MYGQRYVYDLSEYKGQKVTISFKARVVGSPRYPRIVNGKTTNEQYFAINNLTTEWKEYTQTLVVGNQGYVGFYMLPNNNVETWLYIKELQIELGEEKTKWEPYASELKANVSINLEDKRGEIETNDYCIALYKNNDLVDEKQYIEIDENNKIENVVKKYAMDENSEYRIELIVKIKDRKYVLDSVSFNTEDKEIKGITSKEEFRDIQPKGNYILLNDIDLSNETNSSPTYWTYGQDSDYNRMRIPFNGTIDFNGYKLTRDAKSTYPIFYQIGENGIIKNLVFDVKLNNTIEMKEFEGLFYNNYGTIQNIKVNLIESTNLPNIGIELLGRQNYGMIEKFIINFDTSMYGAHDLFGGIIWNYGTIQDGYLYGKEYIDEKDGTTKYEGIKPIHDYTGTKNIAGLAWRSYGKIQNVYSLLNIQQVAGTVNYANILGISDKNIAQNLYSIENEKNKVLTKGPTVGWTENNGKVYNTYYFSDEIFVNEYNTRTTMLALYDEDFQSNILNGNGAFNVKDLIAQECYPHLNMSEVMPRQEYIRLPEIEDEDLPDILSMEIIEQGIDEKNNQYMRVKFNVHNPSAETITNIKVDRLSTIIESQEYLDGKSTVIAKLHTPEICVSKYSVMEITTKGAFNLEYTRKFKNNERPIYVEFYNIILTNEDWKTINNSPTENYKLMNDLDFANEGNNICISKTYSGKFDGNGKTIKNLNITSRAVFLAINGAEIKNIHINNFNQNRNDSSNNGNGFISTATSNASIDNVHIKDYNLAIEKMGNGTYIGGIVGVTTGGNITNCSVTNMSFVLKQEYFTGCIGGIVGQLSTTYGEVKNCFVQNIDLHVKESLETGPVIAGIIGLCNVSGVPIENCYATGNIYTKRMDAAGIIGKYSSAVAKNCYSLLNIRSEYGKVGGITASNTTSSQNLSIGNLYSQNDVVKRICSASDSVSTNYAYIGQKINGNITTVTNGAVLLTTEELSNPGTYTNKLGWTAYDLSQLDSKILPRLYNTNGIDLLPNQEGEEYDDNRKIQIEDEIELESVQVNSKTFNSIALTILFKNPQELNVTNINIDGLNITSTSINTEAGKTRIDVNANPEKYYDAYEITKVVYKENGNNFDKEIQALINAQFYKEINNINDWQKIENNGDYQNYMITGDIDFSGVTTPNINLTGARLEGRVKEDGTYPKIHGLGERNNPFEIKGATQVGLISGVNKNVTNINFEDIHIKNTESGSWFGIIGRNVGSISNCNFTNITINAEKKSYVGATGSCETTVSGKINMNDIKCNGTSYVGAFSGFVGAANTAIYSIDTINIEGSGSNIGGLIGYSYTTFNGKITASNLNVKGNSVVGGIVGLGYRWGELKITGENTVEGNSNVGGIVGNLYGSTSSNEIYGIKVTGKENVGGIVGNLASSNSGAYRNYITNSSISGNTDVGGIVGEHKGVNAYENIVAENVNISGTLNTGGLIGYGGVNVNCDIYRNILYNSTVRGGTNVGGISGVHKVGRIYDNYVNTNLTDNTESVGGIVGYLNNSGMTAISNISAIYNNLVVGQNISANRNAGGLIGEIEEEIYQSVDFYYNNIVEASILADKEPITVSAIIGSVDAENSHMQNTRIKNTYIHNATKINGEYINESINNNSIVTSEKLRASTTYTSDLKFSSTYWDVTTLEDNKYPILKIKINNINFQDTLQGVTIKDSPAQQMSYAMQNINLETQVVEELPEVKVYPISAYELNIEFSETPNNTVFTVYNTDTTESIVTDTMIENKTYTMEYDFKTPITIKVYNIKKENTLEVKPEEIRNTISIVGEEYCYLEGENIKTNTRAIEGEFVNLQDNYAVTLNGELYNLETSTIERKINNKLIQTKPWMEFNYGNYTIKTYNGYSEIINGSDIQEKDKQIVVKNGKLWIIDTSLQKSINGIIIDNYNSGEYHTILSSNGRMYDLKDKINYPENFDNKDILEITSNLQRKDQRLMLKYESGRIYVFDYLEGKVLYDNYQKADIGLLEYIKENLTSQTEILKEASNTYEDSKELVDKLKETPISSAISNLNLEENETNVQNSTINTTLTTNNQYITTYDNTTNSFVVYRVSDILNTEEEKLETENTKIESSEELKKYYYESAKVYHTTKQKGVIYVVLSLVSAMIILVVFYKRKN